jgi:hypothetical protein
MKSGPSKSGPGIIGKENGPGPTEKSRTYHAAIMFYDRQISKEHPVTDPLPDWPIDARAEKPDGAIIDQAKNGTEARRFFPLRRELPGIAFRHRAVFSPEDDGATKRNIVSDPGAFTRPGRLRSDQLFPI